MSSSPSSSSSSDLAPAAIRPLQEVRCDVQIVLGTGSMTVRECLQLQRHSVLRLRQAAGSDLQVTVNGVAVALGEVVIVDDSTAIRITEIVSPSSRDGRP